MSVEKSGTHNNLRVKKVTEEQYIVAENAAASHHSYSLGFIMLFSFVYLHIRR